MNVKISPGKVAGEISIPGSKSYSHRALICAALAEGKSSIANFLESDDTIATLKALGALGVGFEKKGSTIVVYGNGGELAVKKNAIDCNLSGSTMRFITPIAAKAKGTVTITGKESLLRRPMKEMVDALKQLKVKLDSNEGRSPITVYGEGKVNGGRVRIEGNVSSQYISGLLFLSPLCEKGLEIEITTEIESRPYLEITLEVMEKFGIKVENNNWKRLSVKKQKYTAQDYYVEPDYSSAAFMLAAGAIAGGEVALNNINLESRQGDKQILEILKKMNAEISIENERIIVKKSDLKGIAIDVKDTPDLVPICAVLGCFAWGTTEIINAGRAREKESDRLASISGELKKMGACIHEGKDGLVVEGSALHGARISHHDDHRIVMACSVAALGVEQGDTVIEGAEHCAKSYPGFFEDLKKLGASAKSL